MNFLIPDWPAPSNVRAATTLRTGGVSGPSGHDLNLGLNTGDDPQKVLENRRRLREVLELPSEPFWLKQVHGVRALAANPGVEDREADASFAQDVGLVCAVLTADCLPVLFATKAGSKIAAAHAGWRGLAGGVLESTIAAVGSPPGELLAWLGPAISQRNFEVGDEVRAAFMATDAGAEGAFVPNARGRWQADLYQLARRRLNRAGIQDVYGGGRCTFAEDGDFFSYRRNAQDGRMATLIWTVSQ